MIKFQEKEIELDMQAEELEGKIYFETAKLLAYDEVARMIKNVPRKRQLPKAQMTKNHQVHYSTESEKEQWER